MGIFSKNCCDGIYNSFDVHFTSLCDNKCLHCIDIKYDGLKISKPDVDAISKTIIDNQQGFDDVLFLGGEPCLFLEELVECIKNIKRYTRLKTFVTTAVPKICFDKYEVFRELLEIIDGINFSVQHYDENIADEIRKTKSQYDRQSFYRMLPYKNKIRINLNIVKPYLYLKHDVTDCLIHYDKMKFNSIKLSEIQHGKDFFVSFEELYDLKLKSPYSNGCQQYLDLNKVKHNRIHTFKTPLLLKRSCFACEDTLKASLMDGIKVVKKMCFDRNKKYNYGVIYENGYLAKGWI